LGRHAASYGDGFQHCGVRATAIETPGIKIASNRISAACRSNVAKANAKIVAKIRLRENSIKWVDSSVLIFRQRMIIRA
jgi:hypothetical protein